MTLTPAAEFRLVAGVFSDRVHGVRGDDWEAPAPVPGWTARDVVGHLVDWLPGLLGSPVADDIPSWADDPAGAWRAHRVAVQSMLDHPDVHQRRLTNPHIGEVPIDDAINIYYTTDVFLHTWDLARATGQDDQLDPDRCAQLLAGMGPAEGAMRASGQYGPAFGVPDDASVQDRLIAFIGRDPGWRPGHQFGVPH